MRIDLGTHAVIRHLQALGAPTTATATLYVRNLSPLLVLLAEVFLGQAASSTGLIQGDEGSGTAGPSTWTARTSTKDLVDRSIDGPAHFTTRPTPDAWQFCVDGDLEIEVTDTTLVAGLPVDHESLVRLTLFPADDMDECTFRALARAVIVDVPAPQRMAA